jgi:hypothetical protein
VIQRGVGVGAHMKYSVNEPLRPTRI